MGIQLLYEVTPKNLLHSEGNKAKQLQILMRQKMRVPKTWVIGSDVYNQHISGMDTKAALLSEFSEKLDPNKSYAVRSSSTVEDNHNSSYAGVFKTVLNVKGFTDILTAVESIWQSAESIESHSYSQKMHLSETDIKMAVLIQEMVNPVVSGVLFTQNPTTGSKELVVEAVEGPGTKLVQDGITPERYVLKAGKLVVLSDQSTIPIAVVERVLASVKGTVKRLNRPLDFEWVFDGEQIYWVQMREITTINQVNIYSNRFSKDMMPGMIHPLVWSINIPLINTVWIHLLEEMVGKLDFKPQDLAKAFFYHSYFNMGTIGKVFNKVGFPSDGLEMMMGMIPQQKGRSAYRPSMKSLFLVPRLLVFMYSKWNFEKRLIRDLPEIEDYLLNFDISQICKATEQQVLMSIDKLYAMVQKVVYLNILTPIIAAMLTRIFEKMLMKCGYQLSDINLSQDLPEIEKYNPTQSLQELNAAFNLLGIDEKKALETNGAAHLNNNPAAGHFAKLLESFLNQFGHLSDNSNNFTAIPWREQPDAVLDLVRNYSVNSRLQDPLLSFSQLKIKSIRKEMMRFLYNRIRTFTLYRERVSRSYTYSYGLFRPLFLRLSSVMQEKKWIHETNQIFFLTWQEIKEAITSNNGIGIEAIAAARQKEMNSYEDIKLPDVIYGDEPPPVLHGTYSKLEGTPTSPGYYSGPVKIITGLKDFTRVLAGDVVVIPFSDVGWTPIFSKAGAIIAESGGILSHCSIIAREYKIPAVVSVSNALSLKENTKVNVNGYTGEIAVLEE